MSINDASDRKSLETAVKQEMQKTIQAFKAELHKVRTAQASPAILDGVSVDSYGTKMKLAKVANVTAPESKLIMVKPFDASMLSAIKKAIETSGLGLNPISDEKVIRISIPALTEERRKSIVKNVKDMAEAARVSIRTHRQDGIARSKKAQDTLSWSKDEVFAAGKDIQALTDASIKQIDEIFHSKEKEILTL